MEKMTAEQAREAAKGLNFEIVWASLMELRETQQETQKQIQETQKQMQESQKQMQESQKQMQESQRKNDKIIANLSKNIGGLGNTLGRFTESLFSAELFKKFNELGFPFTKQGIHIKFTDEHRQVIAEADFFLENGQYAMPVEIKTELSRDDVNEHLERIAKIRQYMDKREDKRKLVGAVAGGIISEDVLKYAHKKGMFVIVLTGDTAAVAPTPKGFKVREW